MGYREKLIDIFKDTQYQCMNDADLISSIHHSLARREIILKTQQLPDVTARYSQPAEITVEAGRTFAGAEKRIKDGKTAVLNFASWRNPGGGVVNGSSAQEECLCRCSTLYFTLNEKQALEEFYVPHRMHRQPFYNDDIIYCPEITVFKSDETLPKVLASEQRYNVDVITCAAPNMNSAMQSVTVEPDELHDIFVRRTERILHTSALHQIDHLILGAFGCGAFGNDPYLVADAMKEACRKYAYSFKSIVFVIYARTEMDQNLCAFREVING